MLAFTFNDENIELVTENVAFKLLTLITYHYLISIFGTFNQKKRQKGKTIPTDHQLKFI